MFYLERLKRKNKRVMFTKIYNTWSSGYPFLNITKYVVDGVISLNVVSHSWMWW
jgi:hypothetical protein